MSASEEAALAAYKKGQSHARCQARRVVERAQRELKVVRGRALELLRPVARTRLTKILNGEDYAKPCSLELGWEKELQELGLLDRFSEVTEEGRYTLEYLWARDEGEEALS